MRTSSLSSRVIRLFWVRKAYLIEVDQSIEDLIYFVGDLLFVSGGKIANATDCGLEDVLIAGFLQAVVDVLPEVVNKAAVVGDEEG